MKRSFVFTDDRGDGGLAEAARFVGAWAGCVPDSPEWKALVKTIEGFDDMNDDDCTIAYEEALAFLQART